MTNSFAKNFTCKNCTTGSINKTTPYQGAWIHYNKMQK